MNVFDEILNDIIKRYDFSDSQSSKIITDSVKSYLENDLDNFLNVEESIFYENYNTNEDDLNKVIVVLESIKDKFYEKLRKVNDEKFINKIEKKITKIKTIKEELFDDDFNLYKRYFSEMKTEKDFNRYKVLFDTSCKFFGIPTNNTIIVYSSFIKKKNAKGVAIIKYFSSQEKIRIPNQQPLYFSANKNNLKEITPFFNEKGYLCSFPRVYFSMNKSSKEGIYNYIPNEIIKVAYMDPLMTKGKNKSIYIETKYPVAIKPTPININTESTNNGQILFSSINEFMEYYGLEFADDEDILIQESFASAIGKKKREKEFENDIRSKWDSVVNTVIKHRNIEKIVDSETYARMKKEYDIISNTDSYLAYKTAYSKICKFFNADPQETIIHHLIFGKSGKKIRMIFGYGRKKIIIPNGCKLIHVSPEDNLPVLKPTFRSKTKGSYLYPNKRIFFTISKEIKGNQCGLEGVKKKHIYIPKENIKTAWIDQSYPSYAVGAVYVQTDGNIPVTQLS